MKKTKKLWMVALFVMIYATSVLAQDVITLKNGDDIQALVQEIGFNEVKYKKYDNPNGPNYMLKKSDIFMIRYANGSKDVFKDELPVETPANHAVQQSGTNEASTTHADVERMKKEFDAIGTNDEKMVVFLKQHDTELFNSFNAACAQRKKGKNLLRSGLAWTGCGILWTFIGVANEELVWMTTAGMGFMVVGEILTIVSIPISATAGAKKARIKNNFEDKYFNNSLSSKQTAPELKFGLTQSGVGLTLYF